MALQKTALAAVWALLLTILTVTSSVAQDKRPNILLVLFDDVGFMDFGAYGSDTRTPNIDRLAKNGAMFSRYYTSPFCGPSRAMLLTGMDNHQVGIGTLVETVSPEMRATPGYSMTWNDGQKTIASQLSKAGYQTYVTGKWGIGATGSNLPNRFGFDRSYVMDATGGSNYDARPYLPGYADVSWFEDGKPVKLPKDFYSSRTLVDKLIAYIDAGDPKRPFFGFLSLQAVHIPVHVQKSYIDRYNGVFDAGWDVMRQLRLERAIKLGLVPPTTKLAPPPKAHRAWDSLTPSQKALAARQMQVNAGMMEAADEHIGRLMDHLKAAGKLDDTIVVVTSDNGAESAVTDLEGLPNLVLDGIKLIEGFDSSPGNVGQPGSLTAIGPEWASVSSAPFHLYKFYATEGGLRVPLVIAGKNINAAGVQHAPVHVADLVPTLLDAAGVSYDAKEFYGRTFMPVLSGQSTTTYGSDAGFGFEVSGNAALYRGNWKISRISLPRGDSKWRLYDLSVDPGETTDLSGKNPDLFNSMLAEYKSYSEKVGVFELGPDEYAIKQLTINLVTKSLKKYWPYLLALLLVLLGALYAVFRLVRMVAGRPAQ